MKNFTTILFLFLFACNKQPQQQQRLGGALPDVPNNVPILVSSGFIAKTSSIEIAARGKQDKSAPSVAFISPADQSTVSGSVLIQISAKDNVGVVYTSISIDNIVVTTGTAYQWNTTGLPSGSHVLTAVAKDAAGNQRAVSITVFINAVIITPPPASTEVSLITPVPMNQGGEGSCVAYAVGYGARSIEQYYRTASGSYNTSTNVFSPEFLYNQIKFSTDCGSGTAMQTALDFIMVNGICTYQSMLPAIGCSLLPTASQSAEALNYKIPSYSKLYCSDKVAIKSMIDSMHPVIINVVTDYAFNGATAGFIWNIFKDEWVTPHCIVIVGYDDSKNAYKIMNSWGTTWGDAGFGWIGYDLFPQRSGTYCYVMN